MSTEEDRASCPWTIEERMKRRLIDYLACPACRGELQLEVGLEVGEEIEEGRLLCLACREGYPILHGIPRFVRFEEGDSQAQTARNFGEQWQVFDHVADYHQQQFLDWLAPVDPSFVAGKVVLEAGCGKGRHTRLIAEWGAAEVIAIDVSEAIDAAARNTQDLPNVHLIQADIDRLPLRRAVDYAFSVGVLHHLADPARGFASLVGAIRPGGTISIWVYGREKNGWIVHGLDPLRKRLTSRVSPGTLYRLSLLPAFLLILLLRIVYRPLRGTHWQKRLFYGAYLGYIAGFPFREIHNIVHDHLTAPVAFYLREGEVRDWFRKAGIDRPAVAWHNQNSWRAFGELPDRARQADLAAKELGTTSIERAEVKVGRR
jgi:SAM-dependent methyltransferase